MENTILIIEDDANTAALITLYCEREGFRTFAAADGLSGLEKAGKEQPDLVILDLMLPEMDGWEVCRHLRQTSDIPIIMLTARGDEIDRVSGLSLGADDYVVKPFSPRELVERVKAVLRRTRRPIEAESHILSHTGLQLDLKKRRVSVGGKSVDLTPHEYRLLETLMTSPGRIYNRDELLDRLYPMGEAMVIDRVVDVHIGKLRQKIEPDPPVPQYILTVRGVGYRFADRPG
jgi:DNA-binding response OmpR family regulator